MAKYTVLFFGACKEVVKTSSIECESDNESVYDLKSEILNQFPELESLIHAIAVNQEIVQENVPLKDGDEIAFMPAFSGG